MDALRIRGGAPLSGTIKVSGSKNAALPALAASLLSEGTHELTRVPDLADVKTLLGLLDSMGASSTRDQDVVRIDATKVDKLEAPYDLVRTMRASILVLGPLVARFGRAKVSLPGGCAIGARPIDQHLKGLERLGARITLEHGYVLAECDRLRGAEVLFDMPTVTGTENLMLAATLADGTTVLRNAAREPEITDLAELLGTMGARIEGAGSDTITIKGVSKLKPYKHRVVADRIEFGTFLVAGAMAGEGFVVEDGVPEHQTALVDKLRDIGARLEVEGSRVVVHRAGKAKAIDVVTAPYPGFPTDMQAQLMALLSVSDGASVITETIFENRFMHVPELSRMGAQVRVDGGKAFVQGVARLSGTTVMATDLRASACLVLAGLVAEGETVVRRIYHLDRGYEHLEKKLMSVGARIERFIEA
ncbi:MAG: UDP-N-acetylglucosamine 1-carboxyvinyltransferase [Myxococcota bacterium]|nr:UDP-N-acetylglucosamine 1-carboxyvinyltransferase [Myxococcota bacterium]